MDIFIVEDVENSPGKIYGLFFDHNKAWSFHDSCEQGTSVNHYKTDDEPEIESDPDDLYRSLPTDVEIIPEWKITLVDCDTRDQIAYAVVRGDWTAADLLSKSMAMAYNGSMPLAKIERIRS